MAKQNQKNKIANKTPEQWLKLAQEYYTAAKTDREPQDFKVFIWRQFREGNQWLGYNKTTNQLITVDTSKQNEFVPESDRLCNLVTNLLVSGNWTFWYIPRVMKEDDTEEKATLISKACNNTKDYLEDLLKLHTKKIETADNALTDGTSYIYVGYDFSGCFIDPTDEEEIYDGTPTADLISWGSVYKDPSATSMENCRHITIDRVMPISNIKEEYGVTLKSDNRLASSEYEQTHLQLVRGQKVGNTNTVIEHDTWIKDVYNDKVTVSEVNEETGEEVKIERTILKKRMVLVKWTSVHDKALEVLENPLKDNEFPIVPIRVLLRPQNIDGKSLMQVLSPLNRQANEIYSTMIKVLKRFGGVAITYEKGSGLKITNEPMQIMERNRGTSAPEWVKPPEIPQMYPAFLDRILQIMADYANAHEATGGGTPTGVTSGKALNTLIEADKAANSTRIFVFVDDWSNVYHKLLRRIADFWSVEHQIAIRGEDGKLVKYDIKPSDVDLASVKAEVQPELAHTQEARQEEAIKLYQLGFLSRARMAKLLRFGSVGELLQEQEEDANKGLLPQAGGIGGLNPQRMAEMGAPQEPAAMEEPMPEEQGMSEEDMMAKFPNVQELLKGQ